AGLKADSIPEVAATATTQSTLQQNRTTHNISTATNWQSPAATKPSRRSFDAEFVDDLDAPNSGADSSAHRSRRQTLCVSEIHRLLQLPPIDENSQLVMRSRYRFDDRAAAAAAAAAKDCPLPSLPVPHQRRLSLPSLPILDSVSELPETGADASGGSSVLNATTRSS
ncbi:hypothetical protein BOX15_Mlig034517g1, partial [Macrostomum lignano]